MSRWKVVLVSVLAGTALAALTGCGSVPASGGSCPAIGYVEGVQISVVPARSPAPDLQACVGTLCSPVTRAGQSAEDWSGSAPDRLRLDGTGGTAWFLELDMNPRPPRITLRLYRGGHLEQTQHALTHWRRAEPGNACDLHQTTPPVAVIER